MSELRVTVSFRPGSESPERQAEMLNELGAAMKASMGLNERLSRLPGLGQIAGPLRVFVLEFEDPTRCAQALRAVGGWYMRHPHVTVTFKVEGPAGGRQLQLKSFSTVAFAQAAAKVVETLNQDAPDEGETRTVGLE